MTKMIRHWPKFTDKRIEQLKGLTNKEKYHLHPGPKCVQKGCGGRTWWSQIDKRWRHDPSDIDPVRYYQKHPGEPDGEEGDESAEA